MDALLAEEISANDRKVAVPKAELQQGGSDIEKAIYAMKKKFFSLEEILGKFPGWNDDPSFWRAFVEAKDQLPLSKIPRTVDPERIVAQDPDLALKLCAYDCLFYQHIPNDEPFKCDPRAVGALLDAVPCGLFHRFPANVPWEQDPFPKLVARALERLPISLVYYFRTDSFLARIPAALWQNEEVVRAWAKAGGHFHGDIPDAFGDDEELMLLFLRPENRPRPAPRGPPLSARLLSNKQYMMKTLVRHPTALCDVGANLFEDMDLLIAALSGPSGLVVVGHDTEEWNRAWPLEERALDLVEAAEYIREELQAHDAFTKLILCSAAEPEDSPSYNSPLHLVLEGDKETSLAIKKLIAEYGFPTGKELGMLRRARANLALAGYRWSDLRYSADEIEEYYSADEGDE